MIRSCMKMSYLVDFMIADNPFGHRGCGYVLGAFNHLENPHTLRNSIRVGIPLNLRKRFVKLVCFL